MLSCQESNHLITIVASRSQVLLGWHSLHCRASAQLEPGVETCRVGSLVTGGCCTEVRSLMGLLGLSSVSSWCGGTVLPFKRFEFTMKRSPDRDPDASTFQDLLTTFYRSLHRFVTDIGAVKIRIGFWSRLWYSIVVIVTSPIGWHWEIFRLYIAEPFQLPSLLEHSVQRV